MSGISGELGDRGIPNSAASGRPRPQTRAADPAGVLELVLRGWSIAEMAETSGLSYTAILQAVTEADLARMALIHRALAMSREFRLENLKEAAMARLLEIATKLFVEFPDGMTPDQVRAMDAQRRAIGTLLRLPAFPTLRDSYQDVRGPSLNVHTRNESPASRGLDVGAGPLHGDTRFITPEYELRENKAEAGRTGPPGGSTNPGHSGPDRNGCAGPSSPPAPPADHQAPPHRAEPLPAGTARAAVAAKRDMPQPDSPSHDSALRDARGGDSSRPPAQRELTIGAATHLNGAQMPAGLNRAARRRFMRQQGRNHHGRHPP